MPPRKRTVKIFNIRLDAKTVAALEALAELHSELTTSDLIRLSIIEKAQRDLKKSERSQNGA